MTIGIDKGYFRASVYYWKSMAHKIMVEYSRKYLVMTQCMIKGDENDGRVDSARYD